MQTVQVGKGLAQEFGEFNTIYYSPWTRAEETAEILVDQFPIGVQERMRKRLVSNLLLVEQNFGDLDMGVTNSDRTMQAYEQFCKERETVGTFYLRPPNGESWWDVGIRTYIFLDTIFRSHSHDHMLLVVTHSVALQTCRYHLESMDEEQSVEEYLRNKPQNCGVYSYEWDEDECRYKPVRQNVTF